MSRTGAVRTRFFPLRKGAIMAERKRVLVVDDNRDTVDVLCRTLEEHGYTAIPAYGGVEAIQKARNETLDCVLLDIMMPGCSGLKVCHELKRQSGTQHLPIVILSAKKGPQDVSYAKQLGADDYLMKPVSLKKLLKSMEAHASRNRPEAAALPGQSIVFISDDEQLAGSTQVVLDAERTGGRDWFRLAAVSSCDEARKVIAEDAPSAVVIDARAHSKEAPALCRQLKLTSDTKQIAVVVLLENAADDVKYAWANECLVDPIKPRKLADALKSHLRRR